MARPRGETRGTRRGGSTRGGTQVGASDAGNTLPVVAAGKKAGRHAGDPLDAEVAELLRVARIGVRREAGDVVSEHTLHGVGALLGVRRPQ